MSKNRKAWFAIFLVIFALIEILWPQLTIILFSWVREIFFGISPKAGEFSGFNFLIFSPAEELSGIIFSVKIISLLLSFIYSIFYFRPKNKFIMYSVIITLGLLLFAAGYSLLFIMSFNPQIG